MQTKHTAHAGMNTTKPTPTYDAKAVENVERVEGKDNP